jgi:hypothetical protein
MKIQDEKRRIVKCAIPLHAPDMLDQCKRLAYERKHADGFGPALYRCNDCGLHWDVDALASFNVSCSNCYSDNITVTGLRLFFRFDAVVSREGRP